MVTIMTIILGCHSDPICMAGTASDCGSLPHSLSSTHPSPQKDLGGPPRANLGFCLPLTPLRVVPPLGPQLTRLRLTLTHAPSRSLRLETQRHDSPRHCYPEEPPCPRMRCTELNSISWMCPCRHSCLPHGHSAVSPPTCGTVRTGQMGSLPSHRSQSKGRWRREPGHCGQEAQTWTYSFC